MAWAKRKWQGLSCKIRNGLLLLSFYHHFFQQAESLGFFAKPQLDLSPGVFEELTIAVGFQIAFAIPFAVSIKNIGLVGVPVEY